MAADAGDYRAALRLLDRMRGGGLEAAGAAPEAGLGAAAGERRQRGGLAERDENTYM